MEDVNMGEAMPENLLENQEEIANEVEILPEEVPVYGVRLKMGSGDKPFIQQFQFAADMHPQDVATELNEFFQMKVELLAIKSPDEKPKSYFRKSDVLPRRKGTIDILYKGAKIATGLLNVPVSPSMLFAHDGYGFKEIVKTLVRQAQKKIVNGRNHIKVID